MNYKILFMGLVLLALTSTRSAHCAEGPAPNSSDPARAPTAFDDLVNVFEGKGPYGAIVKVGTDPRNDGIRFGAAAHIGVSPDSYGKYRFAIYVTARDEAGQIVQKHASVMPSKFGKDDSYKWGVFHTHEKPKTGTYTVTAVLTVIATDGSVTILDQGKTAAYTVK